MTAWEGLQAACASGARTRSEFKCQISSPQLDPYQPPSRHDNFQVPPVICFKISKLRVMPAPRTKKASTSVQQSLKSTWTNSTKKTASLGEKKSTVKKPNAVVMAVPIAPKRTIKEKRSATDESSAEESEIESYSSSESDNNDVCALAAYQSSQPYSNNAVVGQICRGS